MKRLTWFDEPSVARSMNCRNCPTAGKCNDSVDCKNTAVNRLAQIEDILGDDYNLDRLRKLVEADKDKRLADIEDVIGDTYDLDRLRELVEADKDGRCVFTRCKIGDTMFVVGKKKIVKARVQEIYLDDMPELIYLVDFDCDNSCDGCPFNSWSQSWEGEWECGGEYGDGSVKQSDFGKTVFLTREADEAALAKEADHE